jgi:transcriptional regulator with XRE-family HTH domain
MRMTKQYPYREFGQHLQSLRLRAGIKTQADLAGLLKTVTQQSISRWEKGLSRPRVKDLALLAPALSVDIDELSRLSGHTPEIQSVVSFDQPFPVDLLSPDSFERFCFFLLSRLYSTATVHRAGGTGHTQYGLDIELILENGEVHTFQCKRHDQFGPAKVKDAIKAHTRVADKKVLLLTRVASPQARAEISQHIGWELWDKEDIARKVRSLPRAEQISLVDTFFSGQRFALLGETEAGPWMSVENFFNAFLSKERAFNHLWQLVGRESELTELSQQLSNEQVKVVLLTGSGGLGKSRLLFQALSDYEKTKPGTLIKVLSSTEELTARHLELLGTGDKLLVVDDAHDREDLPMLFNYAANPENAAKIVLSLRTYGYERIRLQAASVSLHPPHTTHISLKSLTREQSTQLALQVLQEYSGPDIAAKNIARFTLDCPLATVIAAQIVSKEKVHPEFLNNEDLFRTTLLSRFQTVIAGEIAKGKDRDSLIRILRVLALIQPFSPDDKALLNLLEIIENVSVADSNRLIKALVSGGILFKRGRMYRLAPDLLADYIIEESCVTSNGSSSGYAEQVFEASPVSLIEHILVNLGKLDWRLSNGNTSSSRLLDGMWEKLRPTGEYGDTHFKAITSVAYYQPAKALQFAEECIREGRVLQDLPELIRHAAYNFEFVQRACACLWELGKTDARELHQHPQHAIRILKELCTVEPNKPVEYNEQVVRFALALLDTPESWQNTYDPYDILKGILQTEGHTTASNGREFSFSPYLVKRKAVSKLRGLVVEEAISRLNNPDVHIAIRSANVLHDALRYPIGLFNTSVPNEDYEQWTDEFTSTISQVEKKVRMCHIDALVWLELMNSISWHVKFAKGRTSNAAKEIIKHLPQSLDFRVTKAFFDGYALLEEYEDYSLRQTEWQSILKALADELITNFKTPEELHAYLSSILEHIERYKLGKNASPHVLMDAILKVMPSLASIIVESSLANVASQTSRFIQMALPYVYHANLSAGRDCVNKLLSSGKQQLREMVAIGMGQILDKSNMVTEELDILRSLLASEDEREVLLSINAIRHVSTVNSALAMNLVLDTNFCNSPKIADEVLELLLPSTNLPIESLDVDTACALLKKLLPLPNLSEYWIDEFLSNLSARFPIETLTFFCERVEHAASTKDYSFRPCNYGPYLHKSLKFRESSEAEYLMREIWAWMRTHQDDNYKFHHFASQLFASIFFPIDELVISFFREKLIGDAIDIQLIGEILRDVWHTFVFDHSGFVIDFLSSARSHGSKCLENATSALYHAAVSGLKSGVPGQPFGRDLEAKEKSEAILQTLPSFSPAYRLYDLIKRDAERGIGESLQAAEYFDD